MPKLTALQLLELAEAASPPATPDDDYWCANATFDAPGGWKVVIFYDCGDLDYIDSFVTPDGVEIDFWKWDVRHPDRRTLMGWGGVGDIERLRPLLEPPPLERAAKEFAHEAGMAPADWPKFVAEAQAWLDANAAAAQIAF